MPGKPRTAGSRRLLGLARSVILVLVFALLASLAGPTQTALAAEPPTASTAPSTTTPPPPPPSREDDEAAFNRELVQDIADHAEDVEVRDAAKAALATNDPVKIAEYLDTGDAVAKKAAADRKKRVAAENRALVAEWAKNAGPTAKTRAAAVLRTGDDAQIADFVAFGKELADAEDRQAVEDAAALAKRIEGRVLDMVARGGPEVKVNGQAALDSGDAAVIEAFFTTGYAAANKRDAEALAAIEAAQAARNKALKELQDLADRSTRAADARTQILKASVSAVRFLTDTANAMGFGNKAAKQADKIFEEDKPGRPSGNRGRAVELANLTAEANRQFVNATASANEATTSAAMADTASQQLAATGLTHGIEWVQVTKAVAAAAQAAVKAAETAWHAAEATEAASKALDANANAQVHADNAAKYRQSAEEHARQAHELELAAAAQAAAAQAAATRAHEARLKAEQAEKSAWAHAANARAAMNRAREQRAIASNAMSGALAQQVVAAGAATRAVAQQNIAIDAAGKAIDAQNNTVNAGNRFVEAQNNAVGAGTRANDAGKALKAAEFIAAAKDADAAAKAGTAEAGTAAAEAKRARDEVNRARPASEQARREADTAQGAANAAGADAARASAAAAQAKVEAATATREAAKTHDDAVRAQAEADRANAEAVVANTSAQSAVSLAQAAMEVAAQARSDADLTLAEAEASAGEAATASVQAKIAGRASLAARISASGIAAPAAEALNLAGALTDTDSDAALAADVASTALVIGEDQATAAKNHADQADVAAREAAEAATRALAEVAPAYRAASAAAQSAANAVRSAEAAIRSAAAAIADANAAGDAGRRAGYADAQARQDAATARGAAAAAANDASIARQAFNAARNDAGVANQAANVASSAVSQANDAATNAEGISAKIQPIAQQMRDMAAEINGQIPQIQDLANQAKKQQWVKDVQGWIDRTFGESASGKLVAGALDEVVNMGYGLYTLALCTAGPSVLPPGGSIPTKGEACQSIIDGFGAILANPGLLIHLDEWKKDPAKALGMTIADIGSLFIPGGPGLKIVETVGKTVNGVAKAIGAIGAKDIASILTKSSLQFGAARIAQFIADLGAINTAKFLSEGSAANLARAIDAIGVPGVNKIVLAEGAVNFGKQLITDMTPAQLGKFLADKLAESVAATERAALAKLIDELTLKGILGPDVIPANIPAKMLVGYKPFEKLSREQMVKEYWDPTGGWTHTGAWDWAKAAPNNGRVPGTINPDYRPVLGDKWDRFGKPEFGKNLSPEGVPYTDRAIPPSNLSDGYHRYKWIKPWDAGAGPIESSTVAPAFGQKGGGIQFQTTRTVEELLADHYIVEVF